MVFRVRLIAIAATAAVAAWCALGGAALAAFPNFSGCTRASAVLCLNVQSQSGSMNIKGFQVPLDHSIEIRGGFSPTLAFVPAAGTNGFIAQPVNVPGGLLGIELPIGLNLVSATAELAGPPSSIRLGLNDASITMPIKLRLSNSLIGSNCHIGSDSSPVNIHLIVGTTSPPPPNRPISGHEGRSEISENLVISRNELHVDNSFSIPGATGCNIFLLTELLIDAKLRIPSAAGNNALIIEDDLAIGTPPS
jgi:hypothetical protein